MRVIIRNSILSGGLLLAACTQPAEEPLEGAWTLNEAESRLAFTSVKAGEIAEAHGFGSLSGSISADGAASLVIDLASVATNIDIRDERMREVLFETGVYPSASVAAQIDPASFAGLAIGESNVQPVSAMLDLHGVQAPVETELSVTRIAAGKVKVETTAPIIVDAGTYGLTEGIAKLQELASLPGITSQVPVNFSLVFERQP
jgi:polyisoprenoid-binding protein YceI